MQYYEVSPHVVVIVLLCDPCSRSTAVAPVIWDYILGMRVGILLSNSPYIAENFCKNMESPRLLVNVLMFNCVCINFGIGSSTRWSSPPCPTTMAPGSYFLRFIGPLQNFHIHLAYVAVAMPTLPS